MRKCCYFDILFLYCFLLFGYNIVLTEYQAVMILYYNLVKNMIKKLHACPFVSRTGVSTAIVNGL